VGGQGHLDRGQGGVVEGGTSGVGRHVGDEGDVGVGPDRCVEVRVGVAVGPPQVSPLGPMVGRSWLLLVAVSLSNELSSALE
jgi:hypothetical protein